jgi:hypothetical protein
MAEFYAETDLCKNADCVSLENHFAVFTAAIISLLLALVKRKNEHRTPSQEAARTC